MVERGHDGCTTNVCVQTRAVPFLRVRLWYSNKYRHWLQLSVTLRGMESVPLSYLAFSASSDRHFLLQKLIRF